jgi:16S rRNA processing protein RimM
VPSGFTRVGKITRAIGLKGEVSVAGAQLAVAGEQYFLFVSGEPKPLKVISAVTHGNQQRVQFEEITDRTAAEKLRGLDLFVEGEAPSGQSGSLIGLQVFDQQLGLIGIIEDILDYPGQQLVKVSRAGKEVLIPLRDELIVERTGEKVVFDLPEGLLEL